MDYYVDGKYVEPSDLNCDETLCRPLDKAQRLGAVEYVQTGTKPPPAGSSDPPQVAVIETRAVHADLAVSLLYWETPGCSSTSETTFVPVIGPANGDDAGM
jgi:hypothetical protein